MLDKFEMAFQRISHIVKEFFTEPNVETFTYCINCGKELNGRQRKYCSDKCNLTYHNQLRSRSSNRIIRR